jgi:arylsulfatase A-like enzyme
MLCPKECHEAYFLADMASCWLEDYSDSGDTASPFFLKVDVWGPHHPYDVAPPFDRMIDPDVLLEPPSFSEDYHGKPRQYSAVRQRWSAIADAPWATMRRVLAASYAHALLVDDALGRILQRLDRLRLADNTLVIYTADHGDLLGAHGGLFNKEGLMVEETTRIPLAMRWPGRLEAGKVINSFASNLDLPTTVLSAAAASVSYPTDGVDLLTRPREQLMSQSFGCFGREFEQRMLRWERYKYMAHKSGEEELYDLESDPFELVNLAAESGCAQALRDGRRRLRGEMERYGDERTEYPYL